MINLKIDIKRFGNFLSNSILKPAIGIYTTNKLNKIPNEYREEVSNFIKNEFSSEKNNEEISNIVSEVLSNNKDLELEIVKNFHEENLIAREHAIKDVYSDSWLSKNIRPLITLILTTIYCYMVLGPKTLDVEMVNNFSSLYKITIFFYFGGRELGKFVSKISDIVDKKEQKK